MARSFSRLSSSAQLLFTGVALECVNLLLCALAVIPFADANVATALLLLLLIVGGLASSIALVCALVGLVKFRQYRVANICLVVISVVANPLVLLGLYMAAYSSPQTAQYQSSQGSVGFLPACFQRNSILP